jgi:hypothetical protein
VKEAEGGRRRERGGKGREGGCEAAVAEAAE